MDLEPILFGLLSAIAFAIISMGVQIKLKLTSIERLLEKNLEQTKESITTTHQK